jgi:hypothetical protein
MLGFPGDIVSSRVGFSLATGQGLIDFALNLVMAPAYYVSYVRTIIKSGQEVNRAFQSTGASFNGGAAQGSEKLFTSLNKLVNSKVYQFLMIAAGVGDANLKSFFGSVGDSERLYQLKNADIDIAESLDPSKIYAALNPNKPTIASEVSSLAKTAKLRQNVTRWGGFSKNPLSLSTFPASQIADTRVDGLLTNSPLRRLNVSQKNVMWLEQALDAEYMPFYFHDLRTNEIISMPAFVTSFDESYSVNYNSITSYGRQDPVRIYQGTERTINLGFKLVAFGKADYAALWYTVNKFVSMVYPQYSKGAVRQLEVNREKIEFVQPFSQVPAASPLIRIRLGDLFRSNFTDTGLKRLFGYYSDSDGNKTTEGDFKVVGIDQKVFDNRQKAIEAKMLQQKIDQINKGNGTEHKLKKINRKDIKKIAKRSQKLTNLLNKEGKDVETFLMKPVNTDSKGKNTYKGTFAFYNLKFPEKEVFRYEFRKKQFLISDFRADVRYLSERQRGSLLEGSVNKQIFAKKSNEITKANDIAKDFFKSENNAIVRSFDSTKGKGLAGFITSLAFTYDQSVWETDSETGRAPKSVDIAISFTPVHDLPLGLDHTGRLRSLSHPVTITGTGEGFGERNANDKPSVNKGSEEANKVREQLSKAARGFDIDDSIL